MAVATFDPATFKLAYPAFAAVDNGLLTIRFGDATLYLDNTDCSPVTDVTQRTSLLYMITAHLALIGGALEAGGAPGGLVGPIKQATEGSVSVTTGLGDLSGDAAFWAQTPYGFAYWQATSALRSAIYVPSNRYRGTDDLISAPFGRGWPSDLPLGGFRG